MAREPPKPVPYRSQEVVDSFGTRSKFDFSPLEIHIQHSSGIGPLPGAIAENLLPDGTIQVLNIPDSRIPSPLSGNITPGILHKLKEFLVGKGKDDSETLGVKSGGGKSGNGAEVWRSWKRAYDIWNNFYIEGRIDPEWIRDRWAEKEPQRKADMESRWNYDRGDDGSASKKLYSWTNSKLRAPYGGAMKDDPMFKDPPPPKGIHDLDDDEDDPDNDDVEPDDDDKLFFERVQNTLWMPTRRGEKAVQIDYDEKDVETFYMNSDLEVDGGVDCGRFPYQALRTLIQYTSTDLAGIYDDGKRIDPEDAATIIKKNTWDEVTTTIYNLPVPEIEQPQDRQLRLVANTYSNSIRDPKKGDGSLFPFRVHRVMKLLPTCNERVHNMIKEKVPLLPDNQRLLLWRDETSGKSLVEERDMGKTDPWYVPESQRKLRDYPPRRYPPIDNSDYENQVMELDSTIWDDEYFKDHRLHAEYFVTNLHGGDMFINGMQVPKGGVAGPLPTFALIETPGGQVSWWFGVYGRNYSPERTYGNQISDQSRKWPTLRAIGGEWTYAGMAAAEVWDEKMNDRYKREKPGNSLDDDEEWECWRKGLLYGNESGSRESEGDHPIKKDDYPPPRGLPHTMRKFLNGDYELKYGYTQDRLQKAREAEQEHALDALEPSNESEFWPGTKRPEPLLEVRIHSEVTQYRWRGSKFYDNLLKRQRIWNVIFRQAQKDEKYRENAAHQRRLQGNGKRKAEGTEVETIANRQKQQRVTAAKNRLGAENRKRKADEDALAEFGNKRRRLENNARIAANRGGDHESDKRIRSVLEKADSDEVERLNLERQRVNAKRRALGLPEIPAKDEVERLFGQKANGWADPPKVTSAAERRKLDLAAKRVSAAEAAVERQKNELLRESDAVPTSSSVPILYFPVKPQLKSQLWENAGELKQKFVAAQRGMPAAYVKTPEVIEAERRKLDEQARRVQEGREKVEAEQRALLEKERRTRSAKIGKAAHERRLKAEAEKAAAEAQAKALVDAQKKGTLSPKQKRDLAKSTKYTDEDSRRNAWTLWYKWNGSPEDGMVGLKEDLILAMKTGARSLLMNREEEPDVDRYVRTAYGQNTLEEYLEDERVMNGYPEKAPDFPHPDHPERDHTKGVKNSSKHQPCPISKPKPKNPQSSELRQHLKDLQEAATRGHTAQAQVDHGLELPKHEVRTEYMQVRNFIGTWTQFIKQEITKLNFGEEQVPRQVTDPVNKILNDFRHQYFQELRHGLENYTAQNAVTKRRNLDPAKRRFDRQGGLILD